MSPDKIAELRALEAELAEVALKLAELSQKASGIASVTPEDIATACKGLIP